jgi:CheY-like chemotaxis protein
VAKLDGGGTPSEVPASETPSDATTAFTGAARVLVIEDSRDAALTLCEILGVWGFEAGMAHSGAEGIERASAMQPDVVLCDIGLPGMDGYEVARALRAQGPPSLRLIAITGYGGDEGRQRALDAGFDLLLQKPVHPEALRPYLAAVPGRA